jgi:pimeloyl-ACP methyl ester carboxylesterase
VTGPTVCFAHGQESGPWGTKIRALAEVARLRGYPVESLDYQGQRDPRARVATLLAWRQRQSVAPILVGSSMGGYVALAAASEAGAAGVFLLAPALYVPGYEAIPVPEAPRCGVTIVHGWQDEVIPWAGSVRYGEVYGARVCLVPGDHRLIDALPGISLLFASFLDGIGAAQHEDAR